jgi:hypothetical protein
MVRGRWPNIGFQLQRGTAALVAAFAVFCAGLTAHIVHSLTPSSTSLEQLQRELRSRFDPNFPGRGITDYPGNTSDDVPKAYAMILKAELLAPRQDQSGLSVLAKASARFLMDHSDERKDGFPGWGVPIAWDPYGDGSINPAHTKYTISTAIVIDALLNWLEADLEAPRQDVIKLIHGAILPYLQEDVLSPSGLMPYSLEPVDRPYSTFNPAALMAGVLQRFSSIESDPVSKARMRELADKTVAAHIAHKRLTETAWYWHYSLNEEVPNDLAHAGYIMEGLRLYVEHGGRLAGQLDLGAIERHLSDFIDPALGRIMAWPNFRQDTNTPARSYDLGLGLYLVCKLRDQNLRSAYTAALSDYRNAAGAYLKYPSRAGQPDLAVREYEAYILLGLAQCLKTAGA